MLCSVAILCLQITWYLLTSFEFCSLLSEQCFQILAEKVFTSDRAVVNHSKHSEDTGEPSRYYTLRSVREIEWTRFEYSCDFSTISIGGYTVELGSLIRSYCAALPPRR